jgi:hypothetical protein
MDYGININHLKKEYQETLHTEEYCPWCKEGTKLKVRKQPDPKTYNKQEKVYLYCPECEHDFPFFIHHNEACLYPEFV